MVTLSLRRRPMRSVWRSLLALMLVVAAAAVDRSSLRDFFNEE